MKNEVTFNYRMQSLREIKIRQWLVALYGIAILMGTGVLYFAGSDGFPCLIIGFFAYLIFHRSFTPTWISPLAGCHWLPSDYCGELASLCDLYGDLSQYRDRVLAEGRRFTVSEFRAMRDWPLKASAKEKAIQERKDREANCKRLYRVTEPTSGL